MTAPEAAELPADPRLAAAVRQLASLEELPPERHPEVYEAVHREIVDVLNALDAPPGS